jgi:hypothetical protein
VTEEAMAALFGSGHDPVTGAALGSPYPVYKSVAVRVTERLAGEAREARRVEIEAVERARPVRAAVARVRPDVHGAEVRERLVGPGGRDDPAGRGRCAT